MGYASTSVASGLCTRVSSWPSVRTYLTTSGAFASAGVLALGLVAAPPDVHGARTEVRAVQLAALALPPAAAPWVASLEEFIINQAQTVAPIAPAVPGGAADISTALVAAPLAFVRVGQPTASPTRAVRATVESTIDPAIESQVVNNSASAATTGDLLANLSAIIAYPFILVVAASFAIAFFGLILVVSVIQNYFYNRENATAAPSLMSEPALSDSARVTTTTEPPADAKPATETGKADVSPQAASIDKRTHTEQVSTDVATSKRDVTETAKVNEAPTDPTEVSAAEPSATDPASEPAKPTVPRATPRPVVRDSLGAAEQMPGLPHREKGGRASQTAAAGDETTKAGSSSVAHSPADSSPKGGGSADGDADGSE